MQAVIQSLESFVLAMAVAAFAHFGVAMKDAPCLKAKPVLQHVAYNRVAAPQTISRASAPLAKSIRRA